MYEIYITYKKLTKVLYSKNSLFQGQCMNVYACVSYVSACMYYMNIEMFFLFLIKMDTEVSLRFSNKLLSRIGKEQEILLTQSKFLNGICYNKLVQICNIA